MDLNYYAVTQQYGKRPEKGGPPEEVSLGLEFRPANFDERTREPSNLHQWYGVVLKRTNTLDETIAVLQRLVDAMRARTPGVIGES